MGGMKTRALGRSYWLYALLAKSSLTFERTAGLMPLFGLSRARRKAFEDGLQHRRSWFYFLKKKKTKSLNYSFLYSCTLSPYALKKKKGTGLSQFRDLKLLAAESFTVDMSNEQNVLVAFWLNLPDEKFIF